MQTLLVLGAAPCLEQDLEALGLIDMPVMAINRAGLRYLSPIAFWCTYHPDAFRTERWPLKRERGGGNTDFQLVLDKHARNIPISGSSVLLGVVWGLERFERIVIAGAPLDHPGYKSYRTGWENEERHLRGRVTSLSGWTKTFLEGLNHGA